MHMNRNVTNAVTGLAITAAVGTAAYVITTKSSASQRKKFKKNAGKAVRAVENVIENVAYMMR